MLRLFIVDKTAGAIPEVIADAGLVFQEDDVDDLCVQIQNLMIDTTLCDHYIQKGRLRINERFRWDIFAKELDVFYRQYLL